MTKYNRRDMLNAPSLIVRNGKPRIGRIVSVGPKTIGFKVLGMKTQTSLRLTEGDEEDLHPVTFYVTTECLKLMEEGSTEIEE